jgi:two-component system chemotaxis response regulator CheB
LVTRVRTLIVDDSGFFRRRIRELLEADPAIEVIGEAATGREAVREVARLKPDVVTMDIEMPEMDGITAVREIMRRTPTPVLMFSSLTYDGARATLDALDAGAVDFLPKRFSDLSSDAGHARQLLQDRVREVGRSGGRQRRAATASAQPSARRPITRGSATTSPQTPAGEVRSGAALAPGRVRLVVIGTSTGGPVALQKVLTRLPANYPLPLLLIQHMPESFTGPFASRLDQLCQIQVREARDGDPLRPGVALLAPGGRQLGLARVGGQLAVRLFDAEPGQFYKPSVDVAFTEAARHAAGKVLGVVLTGMGADGCKGAELLKRGGSVIWSQDEASSVIYGMPGAVAKAGLTDQILDLDAIGPALARLT